MLPPIWSVISAKSVTKLLKPVVGLLRQMGLRLIIYLDDILFMHSNRDQLEEMAPLIVSLFEALGLMVNRPKSLVTPTHSIEFLGFLINCHIQRLPTFREEQEDTAGSSQASLPTNSDSQRAGHVHLLDRFI